MGTTSGDNPVRDIVVDHADDFIDGSGAGGPFGEALGIDATTAVLTCGHCARPSRFAESRVYQGAGLVARCPGCFSVLARLVTTPTDAWLDLRGATSMRIPLVMRSAR